MPQNHQKKYWGLTRCHGNSILDINIPFTVSHRPCFYSILMKFEANWVKVRWWIQSILKMTHFLLPVGGAITLPHNCHIDAIGFIHRTNHWSVIKIRQYMWTLLDTSCISILAITSSPRHGQTIRYIKNPSAIYCLLKILGGVFQIPERVLFKQPWIADFLLGGAHDMQRKSCSAR